MDSIPITMDIARFEELAKREKKKRRADSAQLCNTPEMKYLTMKLGKIIAENVEIDVWLIIMNEASLYESAYYVLAVAASACITELFRTGQLHLRTRRGEKIYIGVAGRSTGSFRTIRVRTTTTLGDMMTNREDDSTIVRTYTSSFSDGIVTILVQRGVKTKASVASQYDNFVFDTLREFYEEACRRGNKLYCEKLQLLGLVPYTVLIRESNAEALREYARRWRKKPPPFSTELRKDAALSEYVAQEELIAYVRRLVELAREEGIGGFNTIIVSIENNGRKTLTYAIARELGVRAYHLQMSNVLSKWLGETEANFSAFLTAMRAERGIAAIEGAELAWGRSRDQQNEATYSSLKNILYVEASRSDLPYAIFTITTHRAPKELLFSPVLARNVIVIPPPSREEREILVRRAVEKTLTSEALKFFARRFETVNKREPTREELLKYVYRDLPDALAGFGSGAIVKFARDYALRVMFELREHGSVDIVKLISEYARIDRSVQLSDLAQLRSLAVRYGKTSLAQAIKRVENEASSLQANIYGDPELVRLLER